jgi:hypothetical protein
MAKPTAAAVHAQQIYADLLAERGGDALSVAHKAMLQSAAVALANKDAALADSLLARLPDPEKAKPEPMRWVQFTESYEGRRASDVIAELQAELAKERAEKAALKGEPPPPPSAPIQPSYQQAPLGHSGPLAAKPKPTPKVDDSWRRDAAGNLLTGNAMEALRQEHERRVSQPYEPQAKPGEDWGALANALGNPGQDAPPGVNFGPEYSGNGGAGVNRRRGG